MTLSLGDMALLVVLMVILLRANGERPAALWLGHRRIRREALVGLLLIPAIFLMLVIVTNATQILAPSLHNVPENPLEQFAKNREQTAIFVVVAILAGGVREELQRAFLLNRFERHLGGPVVGAILVSAGFGLGHAVQGWDAVIITALLGALWAIVYLRRRSTIAPIVSHAGFDALEILRAAFFP